MKMFKQTVKAIISDASISGEAISSQSECSKFVLKILIFFLMQSRNKGPKQEANINQLSATSLLVQLIELYFFLFLLTDFS